MFSLRILQNFILKISEVALDKNRAWCPQAGCETVCHICSSNNISGPGKGSLALRTFPERNNPERKNPENFSRFLGGFLGFSGKAFLPCPS
jgi:hypothetical protein